MTLAELQSLQHFLEHIGEEGMECASDPKHKTHFHSIGIADQYEELRLIVAREIASLTDIPTDICPRCHGQGEHQEGVGFLVNCSYCGGTGKLDFNQ